MKHSKLILFILTAMSLTTCTSPDELTERQELEELKMKKQYYVIDSAPENEKASTVLIEDEKVEKDH